MERGFYLVWSPSGSRPPSVRHNSYLDAKAEAERLADISGGHEFFVLRARSRSQKLCVMTELLDPSDDRDIPF